MYMLKSTSAYYTASTHTIIIIIIIIIMAPLLPKMKEFNKSLLPFLSSSQNCTKM